MEPVYYQCERPASRGLDQDLDLKWIYVAQIKDKWWTVVNMTVNLQVTHKVGQLLTSWGSGSIFINLFQFRKSSGVCLCPYIKLTLHTTVLYYKNSTCVYKSVHDSTPKGQHQVRKYKIKNWDGKGKAFPLQAWTGPWGSWRLRLRNH
jgi:hypothetical protein